MTIIIMKEYINSFIVDEKDVFDFAEFSKDKNDLHINRVYAENTLYGENIVHGMLSVTYVLKKLNIHARNYTIKFFSPVYMGHKYTYGVNTKGKKQFIKIKENENIVTEIIISNNEKEFVKTYIEPDVIDGAVKETCYTDTPYDNVEEFINDNYIIAGKYSNEVNKEDCSHAVIFRLCSYIIGMIMPGKRALFTKAIVNIIAENISGNNLRYRIYKKNYNSILGILEIIVEVRCNGILIAINYLQAYVRANLIPAKDMYTYKMSNKEKNKKILIIGGTKGIGLELAKKHIMQGAKVILTFYHDSKNAEKVEKVFEDFQNNMEIIKCNVLSLEECINLSSYIKDKYKYVDTIYLSAALAPKNIELYNDTLPIFQKYINQTLQIFCYPFFTFLDLLKKNGDMITLSSIAVVQKKRDTKMLEYICAKRMIENIIESISLRKKNQCINFYIVRPTKTLTEMNNTPTGRIGSSHPQIIADKIYNMIRREKNKEKTEKNLFYLNVEEAN